MAMATTERSWRHRSAQQAGSGLKWPACPARRVSALVGAARQRRPRKEVCRHGQRRPRERRAPEQGGGDSLTGGGLHGDQLAWEMSLLAGSQGLAGGGRCRQGSRRKLDGAGGGDLGRRPESIMVRRGRTKRQPRRAVGSKVIQWGRARVATCTVVRET